MPNMTVLQRIFTLASTPENALTRIAASVLRQINSENTDAAKAHRITGLLSPLDDEAQATILEMVEGLAFAPEPTES